MTAAVLAATLLGHSALGRPIELHQRGDPRPPVRVLVVGCIHGDECAALPIARRLLRVRLPHRTALWVVPTLNPDGLARGTRQNGRGVDLNRNFPSQWRAGGRPFDPEYPGPRPLSEPESHLAAALVRRVRPSVTIWFHQPQTVVRAWGPSIPAARRYAALCRCRLPFRAIRWPAGTAPNWQNHAFPGASSFVVELAPGRLTPGSVERHVRAILGVGRTNVP